MSKERNDTTASDDEAPAEKKPRPKIVDLFAGAGGLSLGAARAGFDVALAVELDKHAMAAHRLNFPTSKHLAADIAELTGDALLENAGLVRGQLDGMIGGPPCQGFSIIGRREELDPRNNLFGKFFELVSQCQPTFFIAENVSGILDGLYDDVRSAAMRHVEGEYQLLNPMKLKASDYGAPTVRERVFFIGYRRDAMESVSAQSFEKGKVAEITTVEVALRGLPVSIDDNWLTEEQSWKLVQFEESQPPLDSPYWERAVGHIPRGVGNKVALDRHKEKSEVSGCFGTRHSDPVRKRYRELEQGKKDKTSKAVRLKPGGLCPTLRAGTAADKGSYQAVRPIHPTEARVITPREAARLQGFPDWFRFAPSKWHSFRQIGNSVSPIVAEAVLDAIMARLQTPEGT